MTAAVLYETDDEMVIITLNRPEALNSINRQLRQELNDAIVRFDRDDQARVAIITGAGRAFCAGHGTSRSAPPTMLPACRRAPGTVWGLTAWHGSNKPGSR